MKLFSKGKQTYLSFIWCETPEGAEFSLRSNNGEELPFEKWNTILEQNAYEARAQWLLLKELLDNGQAIQTANAVLVPNEELCNLPLIDRQLLNLPEPYLFDIKIESKGRTFNQQEFRYEYGFYEPNGNLIFTKRVGCILRITEQRAYFLTKEQFELLEALDDFNAMPEEQKTFRDNLLCFAKVKGLAEQTGTLLDLYLHGEDVVAPKTIRLRLRVQDETLEILPEIEGIDNQKFEESFDFYPNPEEVYNLQKPDSGRTRIVFNDEQRDALNDIKRYRRVSRDEALRLAECPQEYFNPDVVELDPPSEQQHSFSERVREIGFYKPRVYPFISPYKSQWIPGIIVEDRQSNEQRKIPIRSKELDELKDRIRKAKEKGEDTIEWNGTQVAISDIGPHIKFIKEQLKQPTKPEKPKESNGQSVLIIYDNLYDDIYKITASELEEFRHLYEHPPNLCDDFSIYAHQQEGIAWLQGLSRKGLPGGLLADDMGLGKTLQVLSFLEWHNSKVRPNDEMRKPYLIVAPVVLLETWKNEYRKFFDPCAMFLLTLYGEKLREFKIPPEQAQYLPIPKIEGSEWISQVRQRRGALNVKRLQTTDLVLTTYETVRDFQLDLGQINWAVVILDEVQKVKTPGTLVTNAVKALKTDFRVACTGTPVENTLVDLWCITDFVVPGHLGSAKEFAKEFQNPLRLPETDVRELGERVRQRIGVHIKRRLKEEILEGLPEKHIHIENYKREMPNVQLQRYAEELHSVQTFEGEGIQRRNRILQAIWAMRDISDHPLLPDKQLDAIPIPELISQSAKLQTLVELLKRIRDNDEKVILYADRRKTQHLLKRVVVETFGLNDDDVFIVNGAMPGSARSEKSMKLNRQKAVDLFQCKPGFNVIVMSPLAAGVGLNIIEANHVVHFTRLWNPAKEDQATDRVYRLGQKRPAHIYLPMAIAPQIKTFDLILHELLERKRTLSQGALFPTEQAEVTPIEVFDKILSNTADVPDSDRILTIEDIHSFEPLVFEAAVAAIFQASGYQVHLTPEQNDKGADVVALPKQDETKGMLLQAKHAAKGRRIGREAVQEIVAARNVYESKFGFQFQLVVITNRSFTRETHELADANYVLLYDEKWLKKSLKNIDIYISEVRRIQFEQLNTV